MSPKLPRDVDGSRLAKVLCAHFGYCDKNQVGSHLVLEYEAAGGHLTVPLHKSIRVGTLSNILSDFESQTGLSREDLLKKL